MTDVWTDSDVEQVTAMARDVLRFMLEDSATVKDAFEMVTELYGDERDLGLWVAVSFRYAASALQVLHAAGATLTAQRWLERMIDDAEEHDSLLVAVIEDLGPGALELMTLVGAEAGGVQISSVTKLPEPFAGSLIMLLGLGAFLVRTAIHFGADPDSLFAALAYLSTPPTKTALPVQDAARWLLELRLS